MKIQYNDCQDHGLKWDLIKSEIRQFTIDYCRTQARIRRETENDLNKAYIEAAKATENNSSDENIAHLEHLRQTIEEINSYKTAGVFLRSKAQHVEDFEKSSKYFLNIEKRNYKIKHIKKLNISESLSITDPGQILEEERRFYKELYGTNTNINDQHYADFFSQNIPLLDKEGQAICEQPISLLECTKALQSLKNGKSPGTDGFSPDFYKMFWTDINMLVYDSILYAQIKGELSIEQKRGILKLIPKKDKNSCFLKNWRPISILNTDYKIIAQIFARRIQECFPKIISEYQNGYIKGRFIGFNIRTIIDIIDFSSENNVNCLLSFLDFEKAFDKLDWKFIQKTLDAFNFGPFFKKWVKTMYMNVKSCVMNNGYASEFFTIQRGIRQGCPLSALLFILAVEILSQRIQNDQNIRGIVINNKEIKLTMLADDTTLFIKDVDSLHCVLQVLKHFEECSGLKLNYSKTEVLPLGNFDLQKVPVKVVEKAYSLGTWYFKSTKDIIIENHKYRIEELQKIFSRWKCRNLSLLGKATIIKSLAVSKLNYVISTLPTPQWFVERVQDLIFEFLWDGKPPKVKNTVVTNTFEKGGLKIPDIDSVAKSQKIVWVRRIVQNKDACWLQYLYQYIPSMSIVDLLKCAINPNDLREEIPFFYRQILYSWFELKRVPHSALGIRREILWLHDKIRCDNLSLFDKKLYEAGVVCINDLLLENGKVMTYRAFISKYCVNISEYNFMC